MLFDWQFPNLKSSRNKTVYLYKVHSTTTQQLIKSSFKLFSLILHIQNRNQQQEILTLK